MHYLLILSRDADLYDALFHAAHLPNIALVQAASSVADVKVNLATLTIILGEPDLCVPILEKSPNVQWIQSTWAGVTPLIEAPFRGYQLTGLKDVFGPQMREYVFSYILHFARHVATFTHHQKLQHWRPEKGSTLIGKTIAILGVGSIGSEVARTAKHFGMHVIGVTHSSKNNECVDQYISLAQLSDAAPTVDYLVSLLPNTPATHHVVNKKLLELLPNHCVVINAGRAHVIDDEALIEALNTGQISAAVLDVFREEPLCPSHPFWKTRNLLVTPHCSAVSMPGEIFDIFCQNATQFIDGRSLSYLIDWHKGY